MREGLSRPWLALVLTILTALCLPVFFGLGRTDLDNDEAIYSYAADSILATGDWLNPRSSPSPDTVFLEKPPLKFWIVAVPIWAGLLPHDEFGLRFWDAVMAVAGLGYVVALGRRLDGWLCGVAAVLLLFGYGPLWFDHGLRGNYMEAPLFLCYCAAAFHFLGWLDAAPGPARRWHAGAVAAAFLLGFLTKFVAALFLPPVLLVTALLRPATRARLREDLWLWSGVAVAVIVLAAPWFVYQQVRVGNFLWRTILGEHVVTRFTAALDPAHLHPWHYYWTTVAWQLDFRGVAALTALGLGLLVVRAVRQRSDVAVLLLAWFFLPVAAISLGTSKLHHYVYPFLPPLALAAGGAVAWGLRRGGPVAAIGLDRLRQRLRRRAWWTRPALAFLLAVAAASAVLAVQSLLAGQVTWRLGGTTVLRNSNVSPPLAVLAVVLAILGLAPSRPAIALAVLLLIYGRWYEQTIDRFGWEVHPLRTARDCLAGVTRGLATPSTGPLLAVRQDAWFLHPYFYYLSAPSGWQRVESADDPAVTAALATGQSRPVVLGTADVGRLDQVAASAPGLARLRLKDAEILLPGPYAVCGTSTLPDAVR